MYYVSMSFNSYNNHKYAVQIYGFSENYRNMLAAFLLPEFEVRESPDALIICEDGFKLPSKKCKAIVIGESKKKERSGIVTLERPVDLKLLKLAALSVTEDNSAQADSSPTEYKINRAEKRVSLGDRSVRLTAQEFHLFMLLYSRIGETFTREEIKNALWKTSDDSNICDVYICYLRRKLEEIYGAGALLSVRGKGYILARPK